MITLSHNKTPIRQEITLTASKSESNRALIIRALCKEDFKIDNLALAEDTKILQNLLQSDNTELSVGIAGTVMRFMTAYLALQDRNVILSGEQRMKERPIKILVDALRDLGASINYLEKEGYPPLNIVGANLKGESVTLDGGVSSQYISAILMIAPQLKNGLRLNFKGEIISKPYIDMTINMMQYFGIDVGWDANSIMVKHGKYAMRDFVVEGDWSAASYWYGIVALADNAEITLYGLKQESLQGDAAVVEIYKNFGVETEFINGGVRLTKKSVLKSENSLLNIDFVSCPDIAQTVAVTCAALNFPAKLTGLKTLRIKETDRISALQVELNKLGFSVEVDGDDLIINEIKNIEIANTPIKTYNDHRMAMAFAPLALLAPINIENPDVVKKSYPKFWEDLKQVGFTC